MKQLLPYIERQKIKKCGLAATNNFSVSAQQDAASTLLEDEF